MNFIKYLTEIIIRSFLKFLIVALFVILLIKFIPDILMKTQNIPMNNNDLQKKLEINYTPPAANTNTPIEGFKNIGEVIVNPMTNNIKKQQEERERNAPRKIIGYEDRIIKARSWKDCIEEFGRGRNEINPNVVRCQNGYTEKVPIFNK